MTCEQRTTYKLDRNLLSLISKLDACTKLHHSNQPSTPGASCPPPPRGCTPLPHQHMHLSSRHHPPPFPAPPRTLLCRPSNCLASRLPSQRSSSGTTPRRKNSHTRHMGAHMPTPGPLPTGPVLNLVDGTQQQQQQEHTIELRHHMCTCGPALPSTSCSVCDCDCDRSPLNLPTDSQLSEER
jgi:hypothetical protein